MLDVFTYQESASRNIVCVATFKPVCFCAINQGYIAQWLERLTADQQVPGSNPGVPFDLVNRVGARGVANLGKPNRREKQKSARLGSATEGPAIQGAATEGLHARGFRRISADFGGFRKTSSDFGGFRMISQDLAGFSNDFGGFRGISQNYPPPLGLEPSVFSISRV